MARAIYYIIGNENERYKELGQKRVQNEDKAIKNTLRKLKALGVKVQYHEHTKFVEAKRTITETLEN